MRRLGVLAVVLLLAVTLLPGAAAGKGRDDGSDDDRAEVDDRDDDHWEDDDDRHHDADEDDSGHGRRRRRGRGDGDRAPTPRATPRPTSTPTPAATSRPGDRTATVRLGDETFRPAEVTVAAGGTVRWTNSSGRKHTVTGDSFDSGLLDEGGTFQRRFERPGVFAYRCLLHDGMRGRVRVSGAAEPGGSGRDVHRRSASRPPLQSTPASPPPAAVPAPQIAGAGVATVEAADFAFSPERITVEAGSTVRWDMVGAAPHTVTAADGSFDSGMLRPGASFTQTFERVGEVAYRCAFHPEMTGTVAVVAAGVGGNRGAGGGDTPLDPVADSPEPAAARLAQTGLALWAAAALAVALLAAGALVLRRRRAG